MSRKGWIGLAVAWFVLVGGGWYLYFQHRTAQDMREAAARRLWLETVRMLQRPPSAPPAAPESATAVDIARLMAHVEALSYERAHPDSRKKARRYIAHRLEEMGWRPAFLAFSGGINLVVERPGTDPEAGAILLGAHYDTVAGTPGADDNATGVAAVLEAARLLRSVETLRTLRLAFFDAEEAGLLGSTAYARSDGRLADLNAAVVVEMIGYACREKGCQKHPEGLPVPAPDTGDFLAVIGDLEHLPLLQAFRQVARPDLPPIFALPVPGKGRPLPSTRRSDHAPFWDRDVGAVMVTDTAELRNPHYHLPGDIPATLDRAFFGGSAQLVVDATRVLLTTDLGRSSRVGNTGRPKAVSSENPFRGGDHAPTRRPDGSPASAAGRGGPGGGGAGAGGGPDR